MLHVFVGIHHAATVSINSSAVLCHSRCNTENQ